jgi:hypothetical protein
LRPCSADWGAVKKRIFSHQATGASFGLEAETIAAWATERGLAGVVWTDLPCKFNQTSGVMPTAEQVIAYLRQCRQCFWRYAHYADQSAEPVICPIFRATSHCITYYGKEVSS